MEVSIETSMTYGMYTYGIDEFFDECFDEFFDEFFVEFFEESF